MSTQGVALDHYSHDGPWFCNDNPLGDVASLTNGEQGFAVVVRIDRLKIDFRVNVTRALGQLAAQAYAYV